MPRGGRLVLDAELLIRIPRSMKERIRKVAHENSLTVGEVVRGMIQDGLGSKRKE
jgi:hypothetical protein